MEENFVMIDLVDLIFVDVWWKSCGQLSAKQMFCTRFLFVGQEFEMNFNFENNPFCPELLQLREL
ncbi:hypothetical protein T10_10425 [Trichinella papuae]|uniref:Uncharacterized protein n=1 Tax=Trichinella papuae TaxID=268474 RepID=A0A0V1M2F4_9BILA|nr:hypothetical protein T10_10425 [Trichinella papuae]